MKNKAAPETIVFKENFRTYCEDKVGSKSKKAKTLLQELFDVHHRLQSGNDEMNAKIIDADRPLEKRMKTCNIGACCSVAFMSNNLTKPFSNNKKGPEDNDDCELETDSDEVSDDKTEHEENQPELMAL